MRMINNCLAKVLTSHSHFLSVNNMYTKTLLLLSSLLYAEAGLVGIIGGNTTPIKNHPFQVSISVDNEFVCSGSLVHPQWVLTVASCVVGYDQTHIHVRVGSDKTNSGGQVMGVDRMIGHENFTDKSMDNDIALLHLDKSPKNVKTIRIANDPVTVEEKLTVTGWGIDQKGAYGTYKKIDMNVFDLEQCKNLLTNEKVTPNMICASVKNSGPCWGDFGDPLVNPWKALVGMYSFTKECTKYPSVFTNVVQLKPWIQEKMKTNGYHLV